VIPSICEVTVGTACSCPRCKCFASRSASFSLGVRRPSNSNVLLLGFCARLSHGNPVSSWSTSAMNMLGVTSLLSEASRWRTAPMPLWWPTGKLTAFCAGKRKLSVGCACLRSMIMSDDSAFCCLVALKHKRWSDIFSADSPWTCWGGTTEFPSECCCSGFFDHCIEKLSESMMLVFGSCWTSGTAEVMPKPVDVTDCLCLFPVRTPSLELDRVKRPRACASAGMRNRSRV